MMNDQVSEQQDADTHRRLYKLIIGNERLEYFNTSDRFKKDLQEISSLIENVVSTKHT